MHALCVVSFMGTDLPDFRNVDQSEKEIDLTFLLSMVKCLIQGNKLMVRFGGSFSLVQ